MLIGTKVTVRALGGDGVTALSALRNDVDLQRLF